MKEKINYDQELTKQIREDIAKAYDIPESIIGKPEPFNIDDFNAACNKFYTEIVEHIYKIVLKNGGN